MIDDPKFQLIEPLPLPAMWHGIGWRWSWEFIEYEDLKRKVRIIPNTRFRFINYNSCIFISSCLTRLWCAQFRVFFKISSLRSLSRVHHARYHPVNSESSLPRALAGISMVVIQILGVDMEKRCCPRCTQTWKCCFALGRNSCGCIEDIHACIAYVDIQWYILNNSIRHCMCAGFDFASEFTFGGCGTFYLSVFFWQQDRGKSVNVSLKEFAGWICSVHMYPKLV